jgi:hypothetical protein
LGESFFEASSHLGRDARDTALCRSQDERAGNAVGDVVLRSGAMVDRILASATRAPFKAAKLRHHSRIIEQVEAASIE